MEMEQNLWLECIALHNTQVLAPTAHYLVLYPPYPLVPPTSTISFNVVLDTCYSK